MAKKLGPSKNASTGHTATQSVYLQFMQLSVTTKVICTYMLGLLFQGAKFKLACVKLKFLFTLLF